MTFGLGILLTLLLNSAAVAEDSSLLAMFRKKPATAGELQLKAEHGPWLILAATISGDDAQAKATKLANEIRSSLKVPTFVMHKTSKDAEVLGVGERIVTDRNGQLIPKQVSKKFANGVGTEAWAVLVGEFTSTEDLRLKELLQDIRVAQPAALGASGKPQTEDGKGSQDSAWLVQKTRELIWWRSNRQENLKKGPMGAAFVTRNPLLPDDFFEAPKVDEFVVKLNKQVKHSVLDCRGKFTVRVASFRGYSVTGVGDGQSQLDKTTSELDRAAEQADKLTMALRAKGAEAYQFHDRYGSYVMIGSFDELGKSIDGGFQYNPAMVAIASEYCGYRVLDVKDPRTGAVSRKTSLKSLESIPFDIEGKPMAVPRPETKSLYSGSLLGGR